MTRYTADERTASKAWGLGSPLSRLARASLARELENPIDPRGRCCSRCGWVSVRACVRRQYKRNTTLGQLQSGSVEHRRLITNRKRGEGRETRIRIQETKRDQRGTSPPQASGKSGVEEVPVEANNREFMRCDGMGKQIEEHWRSWQSWDLSQLDCLLDPFPIQTSTGQGRKVQRLRDPTDPCGPGPQDPRARASAGQRKPPSIWAPLSRYPWRSHSS